MDLLENHLCQVAFVVESKLKEHCLGEKELEGVNEENERVAQKLQAQLDAELEEEEKLARQREEDANIAEWDDVQAMMDADYELAARLQAEEQGELTIEEKSRLFVELMNKREKHFARLRAEEQRRKPPTKAQKRNTMSTYLKNMAGYKHNQLKTKSFEDIQMLFDKDMKRKQKLDENVEAKVDDDQEEAKMKKHMEIVPDDEVAIDAIPLATNPPIIVDWKIIKEGKMGYFQIIRADGSLKRPDEAYERVLCGDLKVMFKPDVEKKKYPLTPAAITEMLNKKLQTDHWNEMCYQLLKLMTKQLKNPGNITTARRVSTVRRINTKEGIKMKIVYQDYLWDKSTDVVVMAQPVQNINHSTFKSMFEREKLFGNNFNDWFRQLKLVFRVEKKMFVIKQPIPLTPAADSATNLHRQFENYAPYEMLRDLKSMFEKQAGVERFELIQTFHACKQEEGKPVAAYVLKMKGYVDHLERLGYMLPQDLTVGLILNGLIKDFAGFMRNYNMHNTRKTIGELHAMLIEYEKGKGKANGKGKDKQVYIPKPKNPKPTAKEHPAKDDTCHHCKEVGHWKRNCPVYLAELLKKKKQVGTASSSGIFTIELFAFPNKSWVYDTGCGTHICITKQGFREARKLKQGALYLYVGNGVRAQVEAIGSFDLVLPNGLVICLDNCHYAPSITRGVVSVHRLVENGFV
ncbi:retrotransposon protein, putative, ty1-copia subclass [Tanacetum coccineum]